MKKIVFVTIMITIMMAGCCKDFYIEPVSVTILKDNKSLYEQQIYPTFYYIDETGKENILQTIRSDSATYMINQSSDLKELSFKPRDIFIRYSGLSGTDTLEILLNYACNEKSRCSCNAIVLKYMKYHGALLKDHTIRKQISYQTKSRV